MQSRATRPKPTTLADSDVSQKPDRAGPVGAGNAAAIEKLAGRGGGGAELPFRERIQKAFGHHDLTGVTAQIGADSGAGDVGAEAYATGESIGFAKSPDLHTAAHEAAHVIQQRAGASTASDALEEHADKVADLVVQGKSAVKELDEMVGQKVPGRGQGTGKLVQMRWGDPEKKKVSGGAMKRIEKAREAINHTKSVLSFGAGNQYDALKSSNFNSYYRMATMRDMECWELDPTVRQLASKHPQALTAAMAELAQGGNCGEHAQIAYDFLCASMPGEQISQCDKEGLDHAFVILGDTKSEADSSLAVSDPWPTAATACLWEDHFAFTADRTKLNVRATERASGENVKAVIARGLKLSAKGLQMISQKMSDEDTDKHLKEGTSRENGAHPWIWRHGPTASTEYEYSAE